MNDQKLVNIVLGNYIRTKRIEKGFTLEKLAEEIDMDDKHLSKVELGKKMPGFMTVYKIAQVLEFHDPFFQHMANELKKIKREK